VTKKRPSALVVRRAVYQQVKRVLPAQNPVGGVEVFERCIVLEDGTIVDLGMILSTRDRIAMAHV